ncbi:MAG: VOC family protein [Candidatus Methanomethyliaceae archaeon]
MRIEHIGIYAHDTEALAKWYENVLRMKVIRKLEKEGRPPIFFLKGESETELEILPASQKQLTRELSDPGYSHLGIVVSNFEETSNYLQEKGVQVEGIRTTTNGWTIGYFTDPEGNRLEIVYRPKGV